MRDLRKDLEICNKATPGPWEWLEDTWNGGYKGIIGPNDREVLFPDHRNDGDDGDAWFDEFPSEADREFIIEARTGWPAAIKRALVAEDALYHAQRQTNYWAKVYGEENERLRKLLRWAIEFISEGELLDNGTPVHSCLYYLMPDAGHCEVCEKYWEAKAALDR